MYTIQFFKGATPMAKLVSWVDSRVTRISQKSEIPPFHNYFPFFMSRGLQKGSSKRAIFFFNLEFL